MASRMWFVVATVAATAMTARAEPAPDQDARRLALAKVWLEVKVAHPAVVRGQVDPDAAMPAAIAKVDAATTKQAYATAIKDLLAPLHDPVTFVEDTSVAPAPPRITAGWIEHPTPKIAVVTPLALATEAPAKRGELFAKLPAELDGADVIVVDLRAPGMEALVANLGYQLQAALPHAEQGLVVRKVVHHGYRTQDGVTSGGYDSGLFDRIEPPPQGGGKARHVVFVGDNHAAIPKLALMLQASGKATIVSSEPLHDTTYSIATSDIELPYGLVAHIRLEEVMLPDSATIAADVIVPAPRSPHDAAIAHAVDASIPATVTGFTVGIGGWWTGAEPSTEADFDSWVAAMGAAAWTGATSGAPGHTTPITDADKAKVRTAITRAVANGPGSLFAQGLPAAHPIMRNRANNVPVIVAAEACLSRGDSFYLSPEALYATGGKIFSVSNWYKKFMYHNESIRTARLSDYSLYAPAEFFAETYTVYYEEAGRPGVTEADYGRLISNANQRDWIRTHIHDRHLAPAGAATGAGGGGPGPEAAVASGTAPGGMEPGGGGTGKKAHRSGP